MSDNELVTLCFRALVDRVGYVGAERFIVMMNREPNDYTRWRSSQPEECDTIEELGARIKAFEGSRQHSKV